MNWEDATKKQLLHIALIEDCDIEMKYEACRELQERYIPEEIRADMIYRLGTGTPIETVAQENALTGLQVVDFLRSTHQVGKMAESWEKGFKTTLKACGRKVYASEKYHRDIREAIV